MNLKRIGYGFAVAALTVGFALASATPSEAAKKKKAEAAKPAPRALTCLFAARSQVCAVKGDQKFTYVNACYAARDGAKVSSDKACPAPKAVKAKKGGKKAKTAKK